MIPTTRIELLDCIQLYLEAQAVKGIRPNTLETTAYYLRPFLQSLVRQGVTTLDTVKPHHLRRWLLERREAGLRPQTVRDSYGIARAFWRWCLQQELTANDPFAKVE
ncbi:MAG: site-specific integrase, partial [Thermoanaerobaculum sp.]